jgi:hypothetical protein
MLAGGRVRYVLALMAYVRHLGAAPVGIKPRRVCRTCCVRHRNLLSKPWHRCILVGSLTICACRCFLLRPAPSTS